MLRPARPLSRRRPMLMFLPPLEDAYNPDAPEKHQEEHEKPNVRTYKNPKQPTQTEIEQHRASGHIPYRSWCPTCIHAKGKEELHHPTTDPETSPPLFSCDYGFLSTQDSKEKFTIFAIAESRTKSIFVTEVPRKGLSEADVATAFLSTASMNSAMPTALFASEMIKNQP